MRTVNTAGAVFREELLITPAMRPLRLACCRWHRNRRGGFGTRTNQPSGYSSLTWTQRWFDLNGER